MAGNVERMRVSWEAMVMKKWILAAVCAITFFAAQPGHAQTINNVPTLLSRSNGSSGNSIMSYMAKFLGFGSATNTPTTTPLGQGTNAFNLPSNTPIASPMYVNRGSKKLSDFFFKPANNTIISNVGSPAPASSNGMCRNPGSRARGGHRVPSESLRDR